MRNYTDIEMLKLAMMTDSSTAIQMQERHGQGELVNAAVLPRKCPRADLGAIGVVFGDDADDLFVNVTLPAGWSKRGTDHAMWSDLLDEQGRVRGNIFYKAAFYDRSAHMSLCRRVNVTRVYGGNDQVAVVVKHDDTVVFEAASLKRDLEGMEYFQACDKAEAEATAWADEHYPEWRSVVAYW